MTINKLSAMVGMFNVNDPDMTWCVYELRVPGPEIAPIYVNACKLKDVFHLKDAHDNSEWVRMYKDGGAIMIHIIAVSDDRNEAMRAAIEHCKSYNPMPRCNLHGYNLKSVNRPILCSNGVTYSTQAEASTALGVNQGNISRCLRGQLRTVGGYSFTYANPEPAR